MLPGRRAVPQRRTERTGEDGAGVNTMLATRSSRVRRNNRILPQYTALEHHRWWPAIRVLIVMSLIGLALFTGLLLTVGGTQGLSIIAVPIAIMAGLVVWLLPDIDRPANPPYQKLLTAFLIMLVAWPNYLAIALPGLPWITPPRLVLGVLIATLVMDLAQHASSRQRIGEILFHDPLTTRLYGTYLALVVIWIGFAPSPVDTLRYSVFQQILDLLPMIVVLWLLRDINHVRTITLILVIGCIITMLVTIPENLLQQPPWLGYIPSWLAIDADMLQVYLSPQARVGDGRYRVRGTFGVVLFYAQYVGIIMPVLLYYMWKMPARLKWVSGLLLILLLQTVWFANARTASLSLIVSIAGMAALILFRQAFFRRQEDPFKSLFIIVMLVASMAVMAVAIANSHRAQMYTIGGDQHAASNLARDRQWANTWNHLAGHPWGVGAGNSPDYVGIPSSTGMIVDSLYINLMVDLSPIGLVAFMGCLLRLAWLGGITFMRSRDELDELAGPMTVALLLFVVTSYVVSTTDINYILFIFGGCILALHQRQERELRNAALSPSRAGLESASMALAKT